MSEGCGSSYRTGRRPGIAIKFAQPGAFAGGIGHDKTGGGGETPGGRLGFPIFLTKRESR